MRIDNGQGYEVVVRNLGNAMRQLLAVAVRREIISPTLLLALSRSEIM